MKTLFERLSKENMETLIQGKEKYPNSIGQVNRELKSKHFWVDLSYHTVSVLVSHLNLKSHNPDVVAELFSN